MIIQYDTRPDATIDEKLRSLIESVQLAFGEVGIQVNNGKTSQDIDIDSIVDLVRQMGETVSTLNAAVGNIGDKVDALEDTTVPDLDGRISALESSVPAAPAVDGAYKLTVTVTNGTPVFTWEPSA